LKKKAKLQRGRLQIESMWTTVFQIK